MNNLRKKLQMPSRILLREKHKIKTINNHGVASNNSKSD